VVPDEERLGYLQLCAERRFHRVVMEAFERAAGLRPDGYWIEARPGGAPSWSDNTRGARIAHRNGARHMGWAAHGDVCLGLPGKSNAELRRMLEKTARARAAEFPRAEHYLLFATEDGVEVERVGNAVVARERR
jgi:hypothetical protein